MSALLFLLACAKLPPTNHGLGYDSLASTVKTEGMDLAPTVLVQDLEAPPLPPLRELTGIEMKLLEGTEHLGEPTVLDPANPEWAAFLRNDYVGAVRFGGGLIRMGESALEVRARHIELSLQDEWEAQGRAWLDATAADLVTKARIPATPGTVTPPPPVRTRERGMNELDGRDNLNLPREQLSPAPLPLGSGGRRYVLVPYLRSYYAHNGGWFIGHEWGCPGGARVEASIVLYDRTTGAAVWWQTATGRHLQEMKAQPSRALMDQYLLWSEDQVEETFQKGFLK